MQILFDQANSENIDALVAVASIETPHTELLNGLEMSAQKQLHKALEVHGFKGKAGAVAALAAPADLDAKFVIVLGVGEGSLQDFEKAGGLLTSELKKLKLKKAQIQQDDSFDAEQAAHLLFGAKLKDYSFDKYKTVKKDKIHHVDAISLVGQELGHVKEVYASLEKIADGVALAKDLVSEPGNVIYPESFADKCKELESLGVEVELLDEAKLTELGMGSLLGVAMGSAAKPYVAVMKWNGAEDKDEAPVAFVGKGVTFDTGGISLKPPGGMEDMKFDMAGAGAVTGAMKALAGRKAKANVVGVVGLVENMPSDRAQRPGDVVTSMSGQTIEVINTDAEGRLVLADVLYYTEEKFKPKAMVDLATLTGAVLVALGENYAGVMSESDDIIVGLTSAGETSGEELWRLPLGGKLDKAINSEIADMKNTGEARLAGSSIGGQFLSRFVRDVPWAHIDIAGMAWSKKGSETSVKGATGFGVRLLNDYVAANFE